MTGQSAGTGGRQSLFAGLKNLLLTALSIGRTRAELLVTEIEEEKFRLLSLLIRAVFGVMLLFLALVMLVFFIALLFWEQRIVVFGALALLFLLAGGVVLQQLRRQAAAPSALFRSSLGELDADIAQLRASSAAASRE